jgi:hypothetical protein
MAERRIKPIASTFLEIRPKPLVSGVSGSFAEEEEAIIGQFLVEKSLPDF